MQLQGYDLAGIVKMWWDSSRDWSDAVERRSQALQELEAGKMRVGSCPFCERAAGTHGALPWDMSGVSQELVGKDYQADQCGGWFCGYLSAVDHLIRKK